MRLANIVHQVSRKPYAVLVIDPQNDEYHAKGEFAKHGGILFMRRTLTDGIVPLLETARKTRTPHAFTQAAYPQGKFPAPFDRLLSVDPEFIDPDTGKIDPHWRVKLCPEIKGGPTFPKDEYFTFGFAKKDNGLLGWLAQKAPSGVVFVAGCTLNHCAWIALESLMTKGFIPVAVEGAIGVRDKYIADGTYGRQIGELERHSEIVLATLDETLKVMRSKK